MNDEVIRLRQLRKTALKLRALASSLVTGKQPRELYERASVLNWRIARIATGKLRSHPYLSYQKDPGLLETGADRIESYLQATVARMRGKGMHVFLEAMSAGLRELADARSLTLSTDLSDALGRAQRDMRALIEDVRLQLCRNSGSEDCSKQSTPLLTGGPAPVSSYLAL